jgi:transient receptor potential cation channel subfamily M protein 3
LSSHDGELGVGSHKVAPKQEWSAATHTVTSPTDAYGVIRFQSEPRRSTARYLRLAHDTKPELIVQLFTREWNLELPNFVITVQGGIVDSVEQSGNLENGLLKAAKTTGAWIFTGGISTGAAKLHDYADDTFPRKYSQYSGRMISIGIAPWGIIDEKHELHRRHTSIPHSSTQSLNSNYAVLNRHNAYFLLADDGTTGKCGAELVLRRELEKYIFTNISHPGFQHGIPMVCVMVGGGPDTITTVVRYVMGTPPVPVVVCAGSGQAADLLANILNCDEDCSINTIQDTFEVGTEEAQRIHSELVECTKKKDVFIIFKLTDQTEETSHSLDRVIIKAVLKSQHYSLFQQLSLLITWNQVGIAKSDLFVCGQKWAENDLENAMMQALKTDNTGFVELLLANGICMRRFLSISILEELYYTTQGPSNTLGYILKDVRRVIPERYTLLDIGLVVNKLMGGAYKSHYAQKKFVEIYSKAMQSPTSVRRNRTLFNRTFGSIKESSNYLPQTNEQSTDIARFNYPFNELFIWAVLTKRQKMAVLMMQHGAESLAKTLIACKLYKAMAREAAEDDLGAHIYTDLRNYRREFEDISLKLLDFCYRKDHEQAEQMMTCELQNWSGETCLNLAVEANHKALLAHPCSQFILGDIWMGGLCARKNMNVKVIFGLVCPFYVTQLEFKTKEEFHLIPQPEEEDFSNFMTESYSTEDAPTYDVDADDESPVRQENCRRRNVVVQENGEDLTECDLSQDLNQPTNLVTKKIRPLKLREKFCKFYSAPITKFWGDLISYSFFLFTSTYIVLARMESTPTWEGYFTIAYMFTFTCEKIREIIFSEPVPARYKLSVWAWNMWNPCDIAAVVLFFIGLYLRFNPSTIKIGRIYFSVTSIYWHLRIMKYMQVNKYLGPLVTIIGKMLQSMSYFLVILMVVLLGFGVSRQGMLYHKEQPQWSLIVDVFAEPYLMLFGEVFAESIDSACDDDEDKRKCETGIWIATIQMGVYLLVANILLINLLIAVFTNIFKKVKIVSHQIWMFQRFRFVKEYKQKPILPSPLIVICHINLSLKYCYHKLCGKRKLRAKREKPFLKHNRTERLHHFEEECIEAYFQDQGKS